MSKFDNVYHAYFDKAINLLLLSSLFILTVGLAAVLWKVITTHPCGIK